VGAADFFIRSEGGLISEGCLIKVQNVEVSDTTGDQ